jgi:hypothetical protein
VDFGLVLRPPIETTTWSEALLARMEDAKARTHKSNYVGFSGYLIGLEKKRKTDLNQLPYSHYNTLRSDSLPDLFRSAMREMLDAAEKIWLNIF